MFRARDAAGPKRKKKQHQAIREEWEELQNENRLLKKLRQGKISKKEFEIAVGERKGKKQASAAADSDDDEFDSDDASGDSDEAGDESDEEAKRPKKKAKREVVSSDGDGEDMSDDE